jgi:hypothetical protein
MQTREWVMIALFIGLLASLAAITHFSRIGALEEVKGRISTPRKTVVISLQGAVKVPGSYECPIGYTVKELLKNIPLSRDVDLKKIPFNKILYAPQEVVIPLKKGGSLPPKKISLEEK